MRPEIIPLLCNPFTGEDLRLERNQLVGIETNQSFPIKNGIPCFISDNTLKGRSKWYRYFYDTVAVAYDNIVDIGDYLGINSEGKIRREYISHLDILPDDKVLETAVGTASNFLCLPINGEYFGIDVSLMMLHIAQRKLTNHRRDVELFHGDGAYLPFKDNTFDLVYQMGGLQFYTDPYRGVREMVRVAKSGTTIHILDEIRSINRTIQRNSENISTSNVNYSFADLHLLIPDDMDGIQIKQIPGSDFYFLAFQKP